MLTSVLALALGSPQSVELHWDAPAECPTAADAMARIVQYTGGAQPDAPLSVEAQLEQRGASWHLRLVLVRGEQRELRELDDAGCAGLAESAALLVAIAISPELGGAAPEADAVAPVPSTVDAAPTPIVGVSPHDEHVEHPPEPRPPAARREPLHVSLRASGGASMGWLPIGGDVGLAVALFWRWLRLELGGTYAPRRRVRFEQPKRAGADVSAWAVGVRACGVVHPLRWLDVPMCAGVEAGQVLGRPVELVGGRRGRPAWAAGVIAPSLRFVVHPRIALWLAPELLVAFTRSTLVVDDEPLFVSAPAGGRLHAGIELRFR